MRLREFDEKERLEKANEKLTKYKTAAGADATAADAAGNLARGNTRFKGINRATKKQFANDAKLAKLKEFAPSGDDGDGFSEETLKRLAAQWYNGDEDPRVEQTLMSAGWEIGQDEGYDNGGVFVVRAGDDQGDSYISWSAEDLAMNEGVTEATDPTRAKAQQMIYKYFGQIYDYGDDDGLDYLDRNGELWNQLMDKYNGEIDDIVAREPTEVLMQAAQELKGIAGDMKYELDEAAQGHTIEAHGVRGMDRRTWHKTFRNTDQMIAWAEKHDAEIIGTRDLEQARHHNLSPAEQGVAEGNKESYVIVRTDAEGKRDVFAGNFDTYEQAQKELDACLAHPLHTKYKQKFEIKRKGHKDITEMDKSQPSAGRDTGPREGPEGIGKPITKEKMVKRALDALAKSMAKKDDKKKDVKEDSISAMRRLAGIVPQVPVIVPNGQRQYRHMPTAVQPR